jgi:hypothetical protein
MVNDLWASKFRKACVPSISSWVLNDYRILQAGLVYVIKLNLSRSEVDNASPFVLQLFDFSTLRYSQIDLMDQKSHMEILINKLFSCMLKLRHSTNRYLWLKNKQEIHLFETLHSVKVVEASELMSWLNFLLDNLFLCFGHCAHRQCIGIPMETHCAVYLASFYLLSYEFDFLKLLNYTYPIVLHRLSLVCMFVDDLFVLRL